MLWRGQGILQVGVHVLEMILGCALEDLKVGSALIRQVGIYIGQVRAGFEIQVASKGVCPPNIIDFV